MDSLVTFVCQNVLFFPSTTLMHSCLGNLLVQSTFQVSRSSCGIGFPNRGGAGPIGLNMLSPFSKTFRWTPCGRKGNCDDHLILMLSVPRKTEAKETHTMSLLSMIADPQSRRRTLTDSSILRTHHDEELAADAGFSPELVITRSPQTPKRILRQTIPCG